MEMLSRAVIAFRVKMGGWILCISPLSTLCIFPIAMDIRLRLILYVQLTDSLDWESLQLSPYWGEWMILMVDISGL